MKIASIVLVVVGIVLLMVSLLADAIGIGDRTAFGLQQIGGAIAGAFIAIVGFFLMLRKKKN